MIAAAILLALTAMQAPFTGMRPTRQPGQVMLYRDAPCPRGEGNDVLVCSRPLTVPGARALRQYAGCVAARHRTESRALLALPPETPAARDRMQWLMRQRSGCAPPGRLSVSAILLQGALAEALVRDRPPRLDPARPLRARDEADQMGLCLIAAAPEQVRTLLSSVPGDTAETDAFAALRPRLDACLSAGLVIRLHPRVLRAMLALSAYRLSARDEG
ncbi:MAG TPA: hypothetical protein VMG08_12010 [Allosphingosinicella sp.]|nr:hypothetical protein [Allosphingosinicella sp.]